MSRAHKPASAQPTTAPAHMDDVEVAATMDSAAAASSAAQAAPAAAAVAPASRRSGQSRTSSGAGSAGSKRPSAASAASASGASHALASIDDEEESKQSGAAVPGSAAAPFNKRARITKHTAAIAAASAASSAPASSSSAAAQPSPMIRILGRDTGAQFVLCEMLTLTDIGRLHGCCRAWRHWIDEGSLGSNRLLHLKWRVPLSLRSSSWAPRYVQRLALGIRGVATNAGAAAFEEGRPDEIALRLLPRLNRLRALQIVFESLVSSIVLPPILPLTSSTLTSLVLDDFSRDDLFILTFLRSLGGLPALTSLYISSENLGEKLAAFDFSVLPSLTQLQRLVILTGGVVRCCPEQIDALVACRALTALDVGVWGPVDMSSTKDAAQLKAGLIKLIRGRNLNGAARLRSLGLGTLHWKSVVTPAMAKTLLAMHELERLEHVVWSCELTSAHWAQLSLFTRLHTIHIGAVLTERTELSEEEDRATLQLDAPLLALQHCPLLSSVRLTGGGEFTPLLLSTEHTVLLAALSRLRSLSLRDVYLESLAPLTAAPALTHLMLDGCKGLDGEAFSMRAAVPRLSLLTSLIIEDDDELDDEETSQFAAVSAAMMERLPLLQPHAFEHSGITYEPIRPRQMAHKERPSRPRPPPVLRI